MGVRTFAIFYLFLWQNSQIFSSPTGGGELEVTVSRGVDVEEVKGVFLYTEVQQISFFIPDLPELEELTSFNCPEQPYTEACAVTAKLNEINEDTHLLLHLLNTMLTKQGLKEANLDDLPTLQGSFKDTDSNKVEDQPSDKFISAAGTDWYHQLKERLERRRTTNKGTTETANSRPTRSILSVAAKGITGLAALFGIDDIYNFVSDMFVSKDNLLNIFTALKAYMPVDRKSFADISQKISEYESFSKQKFSEIAKENADLRNLTVNLDDDVKNHRMDITVIQEGFSHTQRSIADVSTLLFTSVLYFSQIHSFQVCRVKELPMLYVPPQLLHSTLANLERNLPEDIEFAIPLSQFPIYYTLMGLTNCVFDDDGGSILQSIPLKTKGAVFQLFKVRPLQFMWSEKTCVLDLEASFFVREKKSNFLYPLTDVDAALCDPATHRQCRVPGSTADNSESSCVSIILSGGTTDEIKNGCVIRCTDHNTPEVSKISHDTFIATHVPPDALSITCPGENWTLTQKVEYGAVQIHTPCSCTLYLFNRLIGRSTKQICLESDILRIEHVLPAHFITSRDIIHFTDEDKETPRYKHADEIFNSEFLNDLVPTVDDDVITTKINVYSVAWNAIQSLLLAYSFFRMHTFGALLFQLTQAVPRVHASSQHVCRLPQDAYTLLIVILVVCIVSVIPQMVFFIFKIVRKAFRETVKLEATKIQMKKENEKENNKLYGGNTMHNRSVSYDSELETVL